MTFHVYENWVAEKKVVIHRSECGFCNDGNGCHKNPLDNKNGQWHGPFNTYDDAKKFSKNKENRILKDCGHCNPHV